MFVVQRGVVAVELLRRRRQEVPRGRPPRRRRDRADPRRARDPRARGHAVHQRQAGPVPRRRERQGQLTSRSRMIPVFEPDIGEDEIEAVVDALRSAARSPARSARAIPEVRSGSSRSTSATRARRRGLRSGTTALQLAVAARGIGPGDEVLVSACTNIATRARRVSQRRAAGAGRLRGG